MFISKFWSWVSLTIVLTLCMNLDDVTAANKAALVGTVYCDTCFHREFSQSSHFISGALVAVECGGVSGRKSRFWEEVKTDEKGEFRVQLPFEASKHVSQIKRCSVKLISSSDPDCAVAPTMIPSSIRLKVKTPQNHVFSAGFFIFQPLEQPKRCQTESRNSNDEYIASTPFPSPVADDDEMLSSPVELDDLSDINNPGILYPPNQFLPPSLIPSFQFQPPPDSMFNLDFQPPPPSMFNATSFQPPLPLFMPQLFTPPPPLLPSFPFPQVDPQPDLIQSIPPPPPPPPSMFSPIDPQPDLGQSMPTPPSMFTPVDPQPDLIQSVPPPQVMPAPTLLPPFPFQPSPGLPRMPPTTSSSNIKKTSAP